MHANMFLFFFCLKMNDSSAHPFMHRYGYFIIDLVSYFSNADCITVLMRKALIFFVYHRTSLTLYNS